MLIYVLVGLVVGYVSGSDPVRVEEGSRPFQVSLRLHDVVHNKDNYFCSGTILDPKWVVTAGRCLVNKNTQRIRVVAGIIKINSGGSWHRVEKVIIHENYENWGVPNDIGLLKIKDKIEFNDKISSISLPKSITPPGSNCVVSGWGYVNSNGEFANGLSAFNVTTLSTEQCRKTALQKWKGQRLITDREICAFTDDGSGMCLSDEGAPLTKNDELVGIASIKVPCLDDMPNVYVRVYDHKGWISSHMK